MKLVKVYFLFYLLSFCLNGQAQRTIQINKGNFSINSFHDSTTTTQISDFVNAKLEKIVLVRIKPHDERKTFIDPYNSSPITIESQLKIYKTIIKNDSIKYDMIEDSINVRESDFIEIIRLLFTQENSSKTGLCGYEPRNGIIFFGLNNEFLGFFEICFKCSQYSTTKNLPAISIDGNDFDVLKDIFKFYTIDIH